MDFLEEINWEDLDRLDVVEYFGDHTEREPNIERNRFNPFLGYNDVRFLKKYRFTKGFATKIVELVADEIPHDPRGATIDPHIQVACALRCWSRHQIQDDSGDMHGISQPAVSQTCRNVAEALAKKSNEFIFMPRTVHDQAEVVRKFRLLSNFPTVIGAIDCTHVRVKKVSGDLSEAYINRKGYFSLNVQVVCDADLKIRDIVARWRGSVHDSRIFNESSIKSRFERGEFQGKLLGDSGYACTPYLFTPILNPTTEQEEAYNAAHIRTRNTVERCFGVWKQRFRCLLRGMYMKLSTAKTTIVALAVLHNMAIDMREYGNLVRYVQQPQVPVVVQRDTVRGAIMRRNFIVQNF